MAADTFSTSLRLQLQGTGNNNALWGVIADNQFQNISDAITGDNGYAGGVGGINLAGLTTYTLTANNGTSDQARQQLYPFVGALSAACTVTIPGVVKIGQVLNATTGGQNVILTTGGAGGVLTVPPDGNWRSYYCDGTNVIAIPQAISGPIIGATTGINAGAGQVGEYMSTTSSGGVALETNTPGALVSITLTPGDWDVWGSVLIQPGPASATTGGLVGTSLSNTALPAWPSGGVTLVAVTATASVLALWTGAWQYNVAANTPVYLVPNLGFTGTATGKGFIAGRRRR